MQRELEKEQTKEVTRRQQVWVYKTKEQLEQENPSRAEGLSARKEALWRRQCMSLMQKAGMQLRM